LSLFPAAWYNEKSGEIRYLLPHENFDPLFDFAQNGNCDNGKTNDERRPKQHGVNVYPTGSVVRVANYSPFRGMRGTIRKVDTISDELEEPFCFYLVDLEGAQMREPMWFEYDEVEVVTSPLAALEVHD
jgi:hypothetical protein